MAQVDYQKLAGDIKSRGIKLGFDQVGITDADLTDVSPRFRRWLAQGYQGEMNYMALHGDKRWKPEKLVDGAIRVICVRLNYWPGDEAQAELDNPANGYVSRYALGRDYHKLVRKRLQKLADDIRSLIGDFGYRVFCDSAPVLEKPLASKAGLGWIGKHTNLINQTEGSWFFLGELYTDLPLPLDAPMQLDHCGSCTRCIDICPTRAIVAPYVLDARRCISYHTIELKGAIPVEFRKDMGNRIYGCDDCQLVCPWNKFAKTTREVDFLPRNNLNSLKLTAAFLWDNATFLMNTEGSAIRRIGHERWSRNLAVALGNAPSGGDVLNALESRQNDPSPLVREHVRWALDEHLNEQVKRTIDD